MTIKPKDLYRAAALNAFIGRGFASDVAIGLAIEAANKMESAIKKEWEETQ